MLVIKSKPENFMSDGIFPQSFNSILNSFFDEGKKPNPFNFIPAADILETESGYEIKMSLPGIKKEDVKISMDGDHLSIEGERKQLEAGSKFLKREMSYGKFSRSFTIAKADVTAVEAKFEDGILSIQLPKKAEEKASVIKIS